MPWPVPLPDVIIGRAASVYESTPALAGIDARSSRSVAGASCRVVGMTAFDLYLEQGALALDLMPDTATSDWLDRHGGIWGVPRQPPSFAIGNAILAATADTVLPAGLSLIAASGQAYVTTAEVTVGGAGTASVPVEASVAGSAGNASAGTALALVSPILDIAGLPITGATVDANGLAGGNDQQSDDSLRAAILARIRQPPNGGSLADYIAWAESAGAGYVNPVPGWIGGGSVGVVVAMPGPSVPTPAQLAAIDAVLQVQRPVTAQVVTVAATLQPVPVTVHLNPDTTAIRLAAQDALALFFAQDGQIGGTVYVSRLDDALANADGEFSHERVAPAADVAMTSAQMPVLGPVTFV